MTLAAISPFGGALSFSSGRIKGLGYPMLRKVK